MQLDADTRAAPDAARVRAYEAIYGEYQALDAACRGLNGAARGR